MPLIPAFSLSKIVRVSKNVMFIDQALKTWFELVMIPRYNALGLAVPPTLEFLRELVANDMCVFVQDISSPNALANVATLNAAVRRVHGVFSSIRAIERRDAGTLHLTTPAHRQIVINSHNQRLAAGTHHLTTPAHRQTVTNANNRRVADGTHRFLHRHLWSSDFRDFDAKLKAYILFTIIIDGITYDAQPKARTTYEFDFGECDLNKWKVDQLFNSNTRVDPGWFPRIDALRAVLALKPDNRCMPRPIWDASKYAHITRRIENGYQGD
jgi:hypothetical protein